MSTNELNSKKEGVIKKRQFHLPHTYVIIFWMVILAAILTYIIPAGQYDRIDDPVTGKTLVVMDSFKFIASNHAGIMELLNAAPAGLIATASLVFFILLVGGSIQIITATGAIDVLLGKFIYALKDKSILVIPIVMILFSLGGATIGMSNEILPFIPIGIMIARKAGFDALVGTSMISIGASSGFVAGVMNPYTVGVSQALADLPIFSGIQLRIFLHIALLGSACIYIMLYARKVRKNPEKSIVRELELASANEVTKDEIRTDAKPRDYLVLLTFVLGLVWIVYGVLTYEWDVEQMMPVFLGIGIACGFVGGFGPSRIAKEFVTGAKMMVFGALIVGLARGILVILEGGLILDTMIYGLSNALAPLPGVIAPIGIFIVVSLLNFVISSGSGLAASTMPIFIPLADILHINRQIVVLAFQLGDGVTNCVSPISGNMQAYIALAKIDYTKWLRYIVPLVGIWVIISIVFITIAEAIGYGPF